MSCVDFKSLFSIILIHLTVTSFVLYFIVRFVLPDEISTPAADPASAPPILDTKAYLLSILPDSTVENTPTLQVWQNLLVNSAALSDVVENNSGKSFEEKEEDKVIGERVIDGEREYKREGGNEKEVVEVRAVGGTIGEGGAVEGSGRAQEMQCPPFMRKITAKMRDSIHRAIIGNTYHGKYVDRICNIENKKRGTEAIVWATVKDRVVSSLYSKRNIARPRERFLCLHFHFLLFVSTSHGISHIYYVCSFQKLVSFLNREC